MASVLVIEDNAANMKLACFLLRNAGHTVLCAVDAEIGLTVLFVEQNIDMIMSMAQRCYVMDKGAIVDQVAPADLADDKVMRKHLAI